MTPWVIEASRPTGLGAPRISRMNSNCSSDIDWFQGCSAINLCSIGFA